VSNESARAVLDRMETDESFAERIRDAGGPEAGVQLLHGEGFDVTPTEMRDAVLDRYGDTLDSDELDQLAAGITSAEVIGLSLAGGAAVTGVAAIAAGAAAV